MRTTLLPLLAVLFLLLTIPAFGGGHHRLKPFPPAEKGMERFVIELPAREQGEENFKLELTPGKMMLTDGVNLARLSLAIVPHPLKGWGYTFYETAGTGVAISTLMAAPENGKKINAFVSGTPLMIRYNSRLPVVIYAPEGYEIRYRIWQAGEDQQAGKM